MKPVLYPILALILLSCSANIDETDLGVGTDTLNYEPAPEMHEDPLMETITFPSKDSLTITATLYQISETAPWMLLCHQARWSRGEYQESALKFMELGFNCMAIDQRSGGEVNGVVNETFTRATEQGLPTDYLDAEQDMEAAIDYLYEKADGAIVLMGSSYSSTLACYQGIENDKVRAWISFSPGNYFADVKGDLMPLLSANTKPFWITSSKSEATELSAMLKTTSLDDMHVMFTPELEGDHGSRALWEEKEAHEEYWNSLTPFLETLK